ncbi:MAG TPA: SDR family NAD(P)-dependent oxidoreductase, partial [Acidimicrobiia bacterium]|nr:SDR family NAD(P)-dependent oxidoreductase [Acidimicrobiia bacterium]
MSELRFNDQVAVVTGAGRGLGREHALLLASRGAAVVVNDLGTEIDGTGSSSGPADAVVAEITSAGGRAVASAASVTSVDGAESIIRTALDTFGRLDIVVNNAGINVAGALDEM